MFKKTIATFALVATLASAATVAMPTAEAEAAGGRNAAFAIGAFTGLAVGAIAVNANQRHHYRPYRPAPVYYGSPAPWTPGWYSYCSSRYRSFNPHTGYFRGYDGRLHFCR
ncbi:BA14K family protein [uncultured Cohaesibacter sp.]|uniref:BA14K family protein n=1 Tax=uncultured Cohaesibacter sp. TaxID=1002546 RepID=UPI0029C6A763|nr:BA14K family protein [uncultured Cohaesibacter sp.]